MRYERFYNLQYLLYFDPGPNSAQKSICTMDMRKQFTILILLVTGFDRGCCKPIFFDAVSQALNEIGNIVFGNNGLINFSGFKPGQLEWRS